MSTEHLFTTTHNATDAFGSTWRMTCTQCGCGMTYAADSTTEAEAFAAGYARALSQDDCRPRPLPRSSVPVRS